MSNFMHKKWLKSKEKWKEITITMEDVRVGDKVMGTDGQWKKVLEVLPIHIPETMFRMEWEDGYVECSGTHLWNLFLNDDHEKSITLSTDALYGLNLDLTKHGIRVGKPDGPCIWNVVPIDPKPSRCIMVESDDHQFEIQLFPYK